MYYQYHAEKITPVLWTLLLCTAHSRNYMISMDLTGQLRGLARLYLLSPTLTYNQNSGTTVAKISIVIALEEHSPPPLPPAICRK
jgi:hypothetical protein